jgi:hypothetical protein
MKISFFVVRANFDSNIQHQMKQCLLNTLLWSNLSSDVTAGRRGRDRMVIGFTTTYVISAYHH